mmetsp:Transcript_51468/g.118235  ORF Transcript_51468/g.118235 Transcript_51468/m.118235 type:complete len:208 (+) Transcript_51468:287-910(+)
MTAPRQKRTRRTPPAAENRPAKDQPLSICEGGGSDLSSNSSVYVDVAPSKTEHVIWHTLGSALGGSVKLTSRPSAPSSSAASVAFSRPSQHMVRTSVHSLSRWMRRTGGASPAVRTLYCMCSLVKGGCSIQPPRRPMETSSGGKGFTHGTAEGCGGMAGVGRLGRDGGDSSGNVGGSGRLRFSGTSMQQALQTAPIPPVALKSCLYA